VPRRKSGAVSQVPLVPVDVDGTWYLLSTYGPSSWVHDLRAAGGGNLIRKGRNEEITVIEVDGEERDRVIARFRVKTPKPFQGDFARLPDAADHPAFRIVAREG
jgi:hypothetical protein